MSRIWLVIVLAWVGCGGKKEAAPAPGSAAPTAPAAGDKVATFWHWFSERASKLRAQQDLRLTMETISSELERAFPGVFAEIASDGADKRTLVLSADGNKELFPIVQQLHAARPTVPGWTIVAFRQRAKAGDTIEMGSHKLDPAQIKFVGTPSGGKLDVEVFIPGYTTKEEMGAVGFVMLDHAVGEYDMEMKIAGVEFAPLEKAPAGAKSLLELPAMVDALK